MSGATLGRRSCIQVSLTGWLSSSRDHDYMDAIIAPRSSPSTSVTSNLLVEELIVVSGSGALLLKMPFAIDMLYGASNIERGSQRC